jgi:phage-related minor tail protein
MTDERRTQLTVAVDGAEADAGFEQIKRGAQGMAQAVATQADVAAKGVDGIGAKGQASAQKLDRATSSIIGSVQRATAAFQAGEKGSAKYFETLAQQRGANVDALRPYLQQLDAARIKQEEARRGLGTMGVSAAQTAAALRGVPAQFTDIVTALQGGQKPLTVLLQQGGQLKDMFGGVAPAAKAIGGYVLGLVNPLTITLGLAGGLAYAFSQGREEAEGLVRALQGNGLRSGATVSQINELAKALSSEGFTRGAAAQALGAIAATGAVASESLKKYAATALTVEKFGGQSFDKTAKAFADLADKPTEASLKYNESLNYLTAAQYQQIKALEDQGRKTDAARLAQSAYDEAIKGSVQNTRANLGYLETSWNAVSGAAKSAWDAMVGVGRSDSVDERLNKLRQKIAALQTPSFENSGETGRRRLADAQAQLALLERLNQAVQDNAKYEADRQRKEKEGIDATSKLMQMREQSLTGPARIQSELDKYRAMLERIRVAGVGGNLLDPAQIAKDEQHIREQYADKDAQAVFDARQAMLLAQIKAGSAARLAVIDTEEKRLAIIRAQGLLGEEDDLRKLASIQDDRLREKERALRAELALQLAYKPKDPADAIQAQAKVVGIRSQLADVTAQRGLVPLELQAKLEAQALDESRQHAKDWATTWQQANDLAQQFADQAAAGMAALIVDPLDRARAEAEITVGAMQRNTEKLTTSITNQIDMLRGSNLAADSAAADELEKQLVRIKAGLEQATIGVRQKAGGDVLREYLKTEQVTDFGAGFDKASQSMGVFVQTLARVNEEQRKFYDARRAAGEDSAQIALVERKHAMTQISSYASLAGAAKGFFNERSKGYQALLAAEQTLRAVELAGSIASIGQSLIEGQAKAAVGVANQANGDPYSAFPRMATMAGIMAALGFVVGGFGGSSSAKVAPTNTGTGTVFGDPTAASESINKSIDRLKDVDTATMRYSGQMLASLRNIESSIAGVAGQVVRNGSALTGADFVSTKTQHASSLINTLTNAALINWLPVGVLDKLLGGVIGNLAKGILGGLFGSTKISLADSGVQFSAQSLESILAGGLSAQGYQTIKKDSKSLFGLSSSSSTSTNFSGLDGGLTNQFTNLIRDTYDSVITANKALGVTAADTAQRINGLTVDLGRVSLKGLSSDQIQERLTAVFGAFADNLALSANSAFTAFQKSGEGYFETLVRVASGFETATTLLDRLHVSAVALSDITRTQGDVAAELVRQSLQAADGLTGLSDVLGVIDGTAQDIADAYTSLTDVRTTLKLLGIDGAAVGPSLVTGAGGITQLSDAVKAFEDGFATQGQKITNQAERMALSFGKLGYTLPKSSADFVALVQGIDTSTEAGQKLLGSMLGLSGGFADLLSAIKDANSGIVGEIERIKGLSSSGGTKSFAELQAEFAIKTAQARSGDQAAIDLLPSISQALLKAAEATASSSIDVAVIQAQTLASLQATLDAISDPTKRLKGYASGGDFGGGWRIVGERGSELEATGPARIFSADQTARILAAGNQDSAAAAEVRELRREMVQLREDQRAQSAVLAAYTGRTMRILEAVTPDGTSLATSAA